MQQISRVLDGGRTVGAREASATEGVVGCGGGDGMRRCGPGEWRGRAGVDDDGGAVETSSTTADGAARRG